MRAISRCRARTRRCSRRSPWPDPRGCREKKLVDLFWRDRDEKQAHASLRQALAASRKSLGPYRDCLRADPARIAVDGAMIMVDALEFEALASSQADQDRDRALALYRGDLLDGIRLKEEGLEAWIRPRRQTPNLFGRTAQPPAERMECRATE